ncbi:MAG: hypothetical protein QN784_02535 [Nitrososphaeraceae archaeon]|nr:hypothetical protein [Nitrososphaeraceae archaeon]MDW0176340.1 hypothetical protein [Nitrososphaeraceae archaeon]MDW0180918.1 hypothetical protein [Nitrososphaeraceae archaeon]MDW0187486.1 hypothetical protein [Nitrososphaeraceae archaeon]MDW0192141.1 hypothetical protein [Nitrososphaeraceae archaeon]
MKPSDNRSHQQSNSCLNIFHFLLSLSAASLYEGIVRPIIAS